MSIRDMDVSNRDLHVSIRDLDVSNRDLGCVGISLDVSKMVVSTHPTLFDTCACFSFGTNALRRFDTSGCVEKRTIFLSVCILLSVSAVFTNSDTDTRYFQF